MSEQNLREAIKSYKEYQRMMEELESEMENIKDSIKAELTRQGVDELAAGEYKVPVSVWQKSQYQTIRRTAGRKGGTF